MKSLIEQNINHIYNLSNNLQIVTNTIITDIPPNGIVISSPGIYTFNNNINWISNQNAVAITILSSNVILDFNGYTLNCINNQSGTIGVTSILTQNVVIKNGQIKGTGLFGIMSILVTNFNVKNMKISNIGNPDKNSISAGILLFFNYKSNLDKIKIYNIHGNNLNVSGILVFDSLVIDITRCCLKNLFNNAGICSGLGFTDTRYINMKNIKIYKLRTGLEENLNAPGHTCIGIVPFMCQYVNVEDCHMENIKGSCDDAHGISLFVVDNAVVKNCIVKHVSDGFGGKGAKATGIEIYGTRGIDANILVTNCYVEDITANNPGNKQAAAYSVAGMAVKFEKCVAKDITVYNQFGKRDHNAGQGVGFGWAPDIREIYIYPAKYVLYCDCFAENCQVGFDTFNHQYSVWCNISYKCNKISILEEKNNSRIFYCDQCSECPNGPKYVVVNNGAIHNTICKC